MTLSILHLSDIHIKERTDSILTRSGQIASALNPYLSNSTAVVILVSGDVAQAGTRAEYDLASKFFSQILEALRRETEVPIHFVISPGNHDCDFSGDQDARIAIVQATLKRSGDLPRSYVEMGVSVQKKFSSLERFMKPLARSNLRTPCGPPMPSRWQERNCCLMCLTPPGFPKDMNSKAVCYFPSKDMKN